MRHHRHHISRLRERPQMPFELSTVKQQSSRKKTVRTKNTKSKIIIINYENTANATRPKPSNTAT